MQKNVFQKINLKVQEGAVNSRKEDKINFSRVKNLFLNKTIKSTELFNAKVHLIELESLKKNSSAYPEDQRLMFLHTADQKAKFHYEQFLKEKLFHKIFLLKQNFLRSATLIDLPETKDNLIVVFQTSRDLSTMYLNDARKSFSNLNKEVLKIIISNLNREALKKSFSNLNRENLKIIISNLNREGLKKLFFKDKSFLPEGSTLNELTEYEYQKNTLKEDEKKFLTQTFSAQVKKYFKSFGENQFHEQILETLSEMDKVFVKKP